MFPITIISYERNNNILATCMSDFQSDFKQK